MSLPPRGLALLAALRGCVGELVAEELAVAWVAGRCGERLIVYSRVVRLFLLRSYYGACFVVVLTAGACAPLFGCSGLAIRDADASTTDATSADASMSDARDDARNESDGSVLEDGGPRDAASCNCGCTDDRCEEGVCVPALPVSTASLGQSHSCAVMANDALYCWGNNQGAELGLGERGEGTERIVPTIVDPEREWLMVSAGFFHTCAVAKDASLYCWGSDAEGRLGVGDGFGRNAPTKLTGMWRSVSAGSVHTCGVQSDGSLFCWGQNGGGQLGVGDQDNRDTPARVGGDVGWRAVSAAGTRTCATRNAGTLSCWGYGSNGDLGLGNDLNGMIINTPIQVGGRTTWLEPARGISNYHACATQDEGMLWCWGANEGGRTGFGAPVGQATSPRQVTEPTGWLRATAGYDYSCGVLRNGTGWCFGNNDDGKLGTGDTEDRLVPTRLPNVARWDDVLAGGGHTCGVTSAGALWCWGLNHRGQLGLGDRTTRMEPTRVCFPPS